MYLKLVAEPSSMNRDDAQPDEAARGCMVDASIRVAKMLGYSDAAGAIRGYLILADAPLSMDGLVEATGYSKSTISTNMAQLERMGIVRRARVPGDKRHYYATIMSIDEGMKVHNKNFRQIMDVTASGAIQGLEHLERAEPGEERDRLNERLSSIREDCDRAKRLADLLDLFKIDDLIEILQGEVRRREADES